MPRYRRSIGKKLLLGIAVPGVLIAIAGLALFWRQTELAIRNATQDEAVAFSELVAGIFAFNGQPPEVVREMQAHQSIRELLHSDWRTFRHVRDVRVIGAGGIVRWSRKVEEEGQPLADGARLFNTPLAASGFDQNRAEVVRPLGGISCAGCHEGESTMKIGVLQVTLDETRLIGELANVFRDSLWVVIAFSVFLSVVTAVSLNLFIRKPLRRLTEAMRRAEEGDFLVRADAPVGDEIGVLGLAFNQMLARITSLRASEIDTHRDLARAQEQLILKETLEKRVGELSLLYEVAKSLTSTLDLSELLSRITILVAERLLIPQFSIMLVNPSGKLEVKSAYPPGEGTEGRTFDLGQGACGKAAQTLKPVHIADLELDRSIFYTRERSAREKGSLLCVPMLHKQTLLGVLNFQRPAASAFSEEEIELLSAVSDLAALAVTNVHLHGETVALSITDPLTGLPNRRHLITRLEMEIARANRFATQISVLMVDIDHFKKLNDFRGHRAGDEALKEVSALLRASLRKVDLVARYGGEEFVLVLPQVTKVEAIEVAEKLRTAVEALIPGSGTEHPLGVITISVGVANLPSDATALENLVDCADSALYAAKRAGRNKAIAYATGMELHPGRERGPYAAARKVVDPPEASAKSQ